MVLNYDGWVRRIDLNFRSRYPYLNTRIFKLEDYKYQILVLEKIENFDDIAREFNGKIKTMTAPVVLTSKEPEKYQVELPCLGSA